jgi:hypothetical protein
VGTLPTSIRAVAAKGLIARARSIRWAALYEAGRVAYRYGKQGWHNLTPDERRSLGELLRKSRGRRANLSQRERDRIWALTKKAATGRK